MRLIRMGQLVSLICLFAFANGCSRWKGRYEDLNLGTAFSNEQTRALAKSAEDGETAKIKDLIKRGANANDIGSGGVTPLWWAMSRKSLSGVSELLRNGANPNLQVERYFNFMELAAMAEDYRFLAAALNSGGNANLVSAYTGRSPLFAAVLGKNRDSCRALLAHGANVNFQDTNGESVLMLSIEINGYDLACDFLQNGADPTLRRPNNTSFLFALRNNRVDPQSKLAEWKAKLVELLRSRGISVDDPTAK
jgi:ankyrin repeat protein